MDIEKFLKENVPHSHSKMANHWNEIKILRKKGFTLEQVRKFLALNGVTVSVTTISGYIKRREAKEKAHAQEDTPPPAEKSAEATEKAEPTTAQKKKTGNPVLDNYKKPEPKRFIHDPTAAVDLDELFKKWG